MTANLKTRAAPARTPAAQGGWRVVLQLNLFESRRLLRHPVMLLAAAYSAYLLWRASSEWGFPVLHTADADAAGSLIPLALATLIVTNLAASRAHRHRSQELHDATATRPWQRTCAHLLSGGAAALLALVMAGADMLWLALQEGAAGTPNSFELLTGPAVVWVAGALGVLAGVWAPSPVTAPLLVVLLTAAQVYWLGFFRPYSLYAPVVIADNPVPADLMLRPARWHLLYVLGLGVLLAGLALARRGPRVPVAALLAIGLAASAGGATLIRPVPADLDALRSAIEAPETVQTCQERGAVTMCAFAGFEHWMPHWEQAAVGMLDQLPAAADPLPVTIRQFMPRSGWGTRGELDPAPLDRWRVRQRQQDEIPLSMHWGEPGDRLGLAADVAIVALGLQGVQPSTDMISPITGTYYCNAPAIVVLWLSAQSDPDTETVLRAELDDEYASAPGGVPVPAVSLSPGGWGSWDENPVWGRREVQYALQLLDRPDAEVRDVIERDWAALTAPETTRAEAAERLGLEPLPAYRQELLDHGVPSGQLDLVAEETGIPLDDSDAEAAC